MAIGQGKNLFWGDWGIYIGMASEKLYRNTLDESVM